MKYQDVLDRVREISGDSLTSEQAATIVLEVMKLTGSEVSYPPCEHTHRDMLEHYARNGLCGICIHEQNKKLAHLNETLPAGAAIGTAMIGALATHAMINRFARIISQHARCVDCGTPFLETRRHGCATCREDRSWLTKMTKRKKASGKRSTRKG